MTNFLDIDVRGKFQLYYSEEDEKLFHSMPTCRYRPLSKKKLQSRSMSLQPQVEVWKALNPYVKSSQLETSPAADELLLKLRASYIDHRIRVKSAAIKFKGETVSNIPVPLKSTPYVHQVRAFGFGSTVDASALLMEQGTGKTLVAIAIAAQRFLWGQVKKVLIVCPKSVVPVWPKELRKHLSVPYQWERIPKEARTELRVPTCDGIEFLIINYDKLKGRAKDIKKWDPNMIILDESHRIKSGSHKTGSQRSKECHRLGDATKYKLILTGTVLGQCPTDAWSQYRFLNADVFGRSFKDFKDRYCRMGGFQDYQIVGYKNLKEFSEKLHSIAFRTTKKECLDLPPELSQSLYCEPSAATRKAYRELEVDFSTVIDGDRLDVGIAITKLIKLRQIVGGIVKNNDGALLNVSLEKLTALEEFLLNKDWSNKLVIAVSFTHEIKLLSGLCKKLKLGFITLTGSTSDEDRFSIEDTFRDDKSVDVLLIQSDTGGEGLDFVSADVILFYSPTFSFIKVSQLKARIHRIGQINPVTYVFLVMEGTVDEDIVDFLEQHGDLTELILEKHRSYKLEKGEKMDDEGLEEALLSIKRELELSSSKTKPRKKKRRKKMTKKKAAKPAAEPTKTKRTRASTGYTAIKMAADLGIDVPALRRHFTSAEVSKPEEGWTWKSKTSAKEITSAVRAAMKALNTKKKRIAKDKSEKSKVVKTKAKPKTSAKKASPKKAANKVKTKASKAKR